MGFSAAAEIPAPLDSVKWQQRPDMILGANFLSIPFGPETPITVADDWLCLDGSPLSDLHFWGSYLDWEWSKPVPALPPPGVEKFRIQIYSDRPVMTPGDYSRPDKLLYEVWVEDFNETYVTSIPLPGEAYEHKFRYDLVLPRFFWQKRDRIYWLNISAVPRVLQYPWGWESSMDRWNDFAVEGWYQDPSTYKWDLLYHPITTENVNMAFELTMGEGPIKWLQFPDMAAGVNIISFPMMGMIVADDWLCDDGDPITEIHFWGSYLDPSGQSHWEQSNPGPPDFPLPPPPGVEKFVISFHKDVPAGVDPNMPWSHPGELIRLDEVETFFERYWDSVPHMGPEGLPWWEHKFYYIVRLEKPFEQETGNIYWLDVSAVPAPQPEADWVWGWETSKDHWNDSAVLGDGERWKNLGGHLIDFEDLVLGTKYGVGDSFESSNVQVHVMNYQPPSVLGYAEVTDGGLAGGTGQEMMVNNVNLDFLLPYPVEKLALFFGEYGGTLNIKINGEFLAFNNFEDIDGKIIGGVRIKVENGSGNDKGRLELKGYVKEFVLGGQELFVDNVSLGPIDMAFLLIADDMTDYCECDLNSDGNCDMLDWLIFGYDWGRTDCYSTGDCECDINYDGNCDMLDWLLFGKDWGRTDCPVP
jgi:hypothetical protein